MGTKFLTFFFFSPAPNSSSPTKIYYEGESSAQESYGEFLSLHAQGPFHPLLAARKDSHEHLLSISFALACVYVGRHLSFMPGTVTSCCCSSSCCENHQDYKLKNDTGPKCTFSFFFSYFPSSLSAGVKCFHLKLLVAIQESATRTRGREKKRLFWCWN